MSSNTAIYTITIYQSILKCRMSIRVSFNAGSSRTILQFCSINNLYSISRKQGLRSLQLQWLRSPGSKVRAQFNAACHRDRRQPSERRSLQQHASVFNVVTGRSSNAAFTSRFYRNLHTLQKIRVYAPATIVTFYNLLQEDYQDRELELKNMPECQSRLVFSIHIAGLEEKRPQLAD